MTLSTDLFHYNKDSKKFSQEISSLGVARLPYSLALKNPKTGKTCNFYFMFADMSQEGETYGWNFSSSIGVNLLIINE